MLELLSGGFSADKLTEMLSDSNKVQQFLPILDNLANTFKQEGEHNVCALISFEDGKPILRVVATKLISIEIGGRPVEHLAMSRNVAGPDGTPLKFNLLDLLVSHNEQNQKG